MSATSAKQKRDCHIDDVIEGLIRVMASHVRPDVSANSPDQRSSIAPKLYNDGNNSPVELMRFVR